MNSSLASSSSTCSSSSSMDCLSSESSEETELPYGPGIVARLKNRFMKYSMNTDSTSYRNGGHAIACTASKVQSRRNALNRHNKLKRCSSVENILDDEQQQHEHQESDTAISPINNENLTKPRPPLQSIHHSTAPVIKNYFFKSDSSTPTTPTSTYTTTTTANAKNENTATISPDKCNPLPTEASMTLGASSVVIASDGDIIASQTQQTEMSEEVRGNVSKSPVAINGTVCPSASVRADSSTHINDECISSNAVKKAKSMDSLDLQSSHFDLEKHEADDVTDSVSTVVKKKEDIVKQEARICDSRPPQVPERTSIRQNSREATRTAVISPVVKLSSEADTNVTSTVDLSSSSSTSLVPPPVASTRRRSLTRGTTLPSVKPVIAQKPKPPSESMSPVVTPKPSAPASMTQRPIPPPRAPKAPVASVSPLPATASSNLLHLIETKSVTNCLQSSVTPPKPQSPPQISPSASTTSPLIATNGNNFYKNNRNTSDSNNIKNSENGHSSSTVVCAIKSFTSANATNVMAAATTTTTTAPPPHPPSLLGKSNILTNSEVNNANNNCNFNNTTSNRPINKINHEAPGNVKNSIPSNVNVSNMNNINNNNNSSSGSNGRCIINGNRTPRTSSDTNATAAAPHHTKVTPLLVMKSGKENVESKASIGRSSVINSSNCLVFDFRGKNVQPSLAVSSPYGRNAVIDSTGDAEDEYRGCMDTPAPCNIYFSGENEIIGAGSLLRRRDKKLKITFDDTATTTFEYPSEQSLLASDDTEAKRDSPPRSGSGNLASYQPAFIGIGSFELGITKTSARIPSANFRQEQMDLPLMKPAACDDTNPWSKTTGAGPDLLF